MKVSLYFFSCISFTSGLLPLGPFISYQSIQETKYMDHGD